MSFEEISSARLGSRKPHSRRLWWLAPLALAASQLAVADMALQHGARSRAAPTQLGANSAQSAARAAEGGREPVQGRYLRELITDYTRWFFSIPVEVVTANATETGANCGLNQDGPVWNLIGQFTPNFVITCNVPAGKAIFLPALGYAYDFPCPEPYPQLAPGQSLEAFLRGLTAEFIDGITFASITFDGKPVKLRRASTGVHSFTAAKSWANWDVCATGSPQLVQNDGLWALIDPPTVGTHTVNLKLAHPAFGSVEGSWILNVTR
ncbi:MAG: hypothetical protein HY021_04795 [Burkholderiales bacterium]|nr:hypothetical protein [Burkholderiales bacterium]